MTKLRVLHLEDDALDAFLVRHELERAGLELDLVQTASLAVLQTTLKTGELDLILSDSRLAEFTGTEALALAREHCPAVPFIVLSGVGFEEQIAASLKAGATAHFVKSQLSELVSLLRRLHAEIAARHPAG